MIKYKIEYEVPKRYSPFIDFKFCPKCGKSNHLNEDAFELMNLLECDSCGFGLISTAESRQ